MALQEYHFNIRPHAGAWSLQCPVPCTAEECWYCTYLEEQVEISGALLLPPWLPVAPDLTEGVLRSSIMLRRRMLNSPGHVVDSRQGRKEWTDAMLHGPPLRHFMPALDAQ